MHHYIIGRATPSADEKLKIAETLLQHGADVDLVLVFLGVPECEKPAALDGVPRNWPHADHYSESPSELLMRETRDYYVLYQVLEGLTPVQRQVIIDRVMQGRQLADIGRAHGLSRQRIQQIKEKALCLLRHPSKFEILRKAYQ
jgi:DNA-binding CsgD family transcriptional regulator